MSCQNLPCCPGGKLPPKVPTPSAVGLRLVRIYSFDLRMLLALWKVAVWTFSLRLSWRCSFGVLFSTDHGKHCNGQNWKFFWMYGCLCGDRSSASCPVTRAQKPLLTSGISFPNEFFLGGSDELLSVPSGPKAAMAVSAAHYHKWRIYIYIHKIKRILDHKQEEKPVIWVPKSPIDEFPSKREHT